MKDSTIYLILNVSWTVFGAILVFTGTGEINFLKAMSCFIMSAVCNNTRLLYLQQGK